MSVNKLSSFDLILTYVHISMALVGLMLHEKESIAQLRYWITGLRNSKHNKPLKALPDLVCTKNAVLQGIYLSTCLLMLYFLYILTVVL